MDNIEMLIGNSPELSNGFYKRMSEFYISQKSFDKVSHIWGDIFNLFHRKIDEALLTGNEEAIKDSLSNLYHNNTLFGVDIDSETLGYEKKWIDILIATANNLGVLTVLNPEQPDEESKKQYVVEEVIKDIEDRLNCGISRTGGGNMSGYSVGGRFIPHHLLEAVCNTVSIERYLKHFNIIPTTILEIGAGVGNLCLYLCKMYPSSFYHTIDLPIMSILQSFLLAKYFGEESIVFEDEKPFGDERIFIHGVKNDISRLSIDLAINQDSMPEMPIEVAQKYSKLITTQLVPNGLFLSINHESTRGGQINVHDLFNNLLSLIHRVPYWGRVGYVEELWQKKNIGGV